MNWIAQLPQGIPLPPSDRVISWDAPRSSFEDSVHHTSDWEAQGDRYGHAIWREIQIYPEATVGILGYLQGSDLRLKEIQCAFGDRDSDTDRRRQYQMWKELVETELGKGKVDARYADSGAELSPTIRWLHEGVEIALEDYFTKDGNLCGLRIKQANKSWRTNRP
jgi:hypothetical protein